jgi:hypothetical protein
MSTTPRTLQKQRQRLLDEMEAAREEPTLLEELVGLLSHTSSSSFSGGEKSMTIRLPIHIAARLDAMVEVAGVSRNQLARQLLEYAMVDVLNEVPDQVEQLVEDLYQKAVIAEFDASRSLDSNE